MACKKAHTETDRIVKDLPINQGGVGRHKCASCAYEKGIENGRTHIEKFDVSTFLTELPESQKGLRRHRDPYEAYELGFYHGQVEAGSNLTIQNKKGISFSMRNYALSIIARSLLEIFKEDKMPYAHATSVINIAHSFEILIKSKIVEEHPLLIFDKLSNNEKIKSKELDFDDLLENGRTIEYSKLPYRLWATTNYKIKEIELYNSFGKIRNQIIHFHIPMDLSLSELSFKYAFKIVEACINDWWGITILKYIKVFDRKAYKRVFDKLSELDINTVYIFDKRKGYIEK